MSGFQLACLTDPRLAAHALSPAPAWLWSVDGAHIRWANASGAAIFQAASPAELDALSFDSNNAAAAQVTRLAASLPQGGAPRLERLRGFGASFGSALTCQCSRILLADGSDAILIVSTERAGPDIPLGQRVRRLFDGQEAALAAFSPEGELLHATAAAQTHLGAARDLLALHAQDLAKSASRDGHADGELGGRRVTLDRLGAGPSFALLLSILDTKAADPAEPPTPGEETLAPIELPPAPVISTPVADTSGPRRFPLRFIWRADATDHFAIESDEFINLLGAKTAAALGRPWHDIAAELKLDPEGRVAAALASHGTWNGMMLRFPVDGDEEGIAVELSGLPLFDNERNFQGYRGFGICRNTVRINELTQRRTEAARPVAAPLQLVGPIPPESPAEEASATVLPFPAAAPPEQPPELNAKERTAFQELARELGDRLKGGTDKPALADDFGPEPLQPVNGHGNGHRNGRTDAARNARSELPILDRLPVGILIYRLNDLIYANRAFLEWTGYGTLEALNDAGGLDSLFIENNPAAAAKNVDKGRDKNGANTLTITTMAGQQMPVEGRLFSIGWNGDSAIVLMLNITPAERARKDDKNAEMTLRRIEAESRELVAVLDTATDGVLMLDRNGQVLSANASAEALFGLEHAEFVGAAFGDLFAPESRRIVLSYLDQLARDGTAGILNEGKEVIARVRQGGLLPLHLTIGRIGESAQKFCAVFRDITAWKKTEQELINARRNAEGASAAKSEFLAKISHEIRTPLNAIIGFSEVMMEERFGSIGNDRYREYLRDIHTSGGHLVSLLNDLLDLSKIEAGKLDLTFTNVNLNDVAQQCVAIMQEQANRERVIIRTSLPATLPQIVADARSLRQIVLNLLSNSIKFTGAGGQVILSTTLTEDHRVVLRVRDTGAGMSELELQAALEPFRQLATAARWGSSGTGLGLPITKALAEANHAVFKIASAVRDGTLVEIAFPATRVLAH